MVRRGGIVVLAGGVPATETQPGILLGKNLRLAGFVGATPTAAVMRLMESKQVDVRPPISEIVPMAEAQRAFDAMYTGESIAPLLKP